MNLLKENLGVDYRIGTIDKFQGQEEPVLIVSLGVSDVTESSRGLNSVFDINRLNVAVSRAQALAIIVANPTIHHCGANTIEQMERANLMCRLIESGS